MCVSNGKLTLPHFTPQILLLRTNFQGLQLNPWIGGLKWSAMRNEHEQTGKVIRVPLEVRHRDIFKTIWYYGHVMSLYADPGQPIAVQTKQPERGQGSAWRNSAAAGIHSLTLLSVLNCLHKGYKALKPSKKNKSLKCNIENPFLALHTSVESIQQQVCLLLN